MKIVIASGIFIPEPGGPATYAPKIAEEFLNLGHQVEVITYSDKEHYDFDKTLAYNVYRVKRSNKLLNYWRYYYALFKLATSSDLIYAFDHFSAGLPVAIFSLLSGRPFIIRVGGDFIWEKYLDQTGNLITLRQFYEQGWHHKYHQLRFKIICWVFKRARGIIFTTEFQKDIFQKHYNLPSKKLFIINNPISAEKVFKKRGRINREIIAPARFINKNNLGNLIKAFSKIQDKSWQLNIIGAGPKRLELQNLIKNLSMANVSLIETMSRQDLGKRLQDAYLVVFPSLTDISPNSMLECLSLKVPFISSREIGFDWIQDKIITFDPMRPDEITAAIDNLLDPAAYQNYSHQLADIKYSYNYHQAAVDTIKVFQKFL